MQELVKIQTILNYSNSMELYLLELQKRKDFLSGKIELKINCRMCF